MAGYLCTHAAQASAADAPGPASHLTMGPASPAQSCNPDSRRCRGQERCLAAHPRARAAAASEVHAAVVPAAYQQCPLVHAAVVPAAAPVAGRLVPGGRHPLLLVWVHCSESNEG